MASTLLSSPGHPPPPPPFDFWSDFDPSANTDRWFSTPFLAFIDSWRILIIIASFIFLFLTARAIFSAPSRMQRALLTSNAFYATLGLAITYGRLGDPVTLRFLLVLGGVSFGLGAMWYYNFGPNRFPGTTALRNPHPTHWVRLRTRRRPRS